MRLFYFLHYISYLRRRVYYNLRMVYLLVQVVAKAALGPLLGRGQAGAEQRGAPGPWLGPAPGELQGRVLARLHPPQVRRPLVTLHHAAEEVPRHLRHPGVGVIAGSRVSVGLRLTSVLPASFLLPSLPLHTLP